MDILNFLKSISISVTLTLDNILIGMLLAIGVIAIIIFIYKKIISKFNPVEVVEMNINIANIGNVTIKTNKEIKKIAHKAWVEIMTRKVGILFEDDKDVIVEVYNSWYTLFGIIRELLKEIEPNSKNENLKKLEDILIKILNKGLRPHLTEWQAEFRRWYEKALKDNETLSPQEVQKKYEKYDELIKDLKDTNTQMVQFANELKKLT